MRRERNLLTRAALLVFVMTLILTPSVLLAVHEEDIKNLDQRLKKLEQKEEEKEKERAEGKTVDFGGFVRLRYHVSNFTNYAVLPNYDFQVLPPDKTVKDANKTANYFEQRAQLYLSPRFSDYVSGTFAFEFDYRLGDSAYGVGRNEGGGFNADQTNIETKNVLISAKVPGTNLSAVLGLQTIKDAYNGIILGWSDAGGITLNYKFQDNVDALLGFYRFWQPAARLKKSVAADFVRAEVGLSPAKDLRLGLNLYALFDRTGVDGDGALGGAAIGSTSNGFAPLSYNASTGHESLVGSTRYTMNLFLPGINFDYKLGRFKISGFAIYEAGKFDSSTEGIGDVTISSYAADLGVGTTIGPVNAKLEGIYVSGDNSGENPSVGIKKKGFYTPGSYSLAGAWMGLTGMKILFPDIDGTNQDQYLVYDVTNTLEQKPLGVMAVMLTGDMQIAPKTTLEAGIGTLSSAVKRAVNNKRYMATEINAGIHHQIYKPLSVGIVGAYAWVGDFYKVTDAEAAAFNATKSGNPVTANREPADMWRIYTRVNYSF